MNDLRTVGLFATWALLLLSDRSLAEGTVTGSGTTEIKRLPDTLRMQVELIAKGKDLKEALAKLKERRETARTALAGLGVVKDTIEIGDAAVSSEKSDRQIQMERMMRRAGRPGKSKPKTPPPVVVAALLKVDLPLKAADPEELLVRSQEFQDKVKAADLGGMKDLEKLTPQEEELAEEMGVGEDGDGPRRGEPTFLFVGKVSDEERARALAAAFQKAKKDAARLASAAGAALGELRHLSDSQQSVSDNDPDDGPRRYYEVERLRRLGLSGDEQPAEAISTQPTRVTLRVTVTAQFALKPAP